MGADDCRPRAEPPASAAALLEQHFDAAFAAPDGLKKLRELILTLAMQGKLVEQDPRPACERAADRDRAGEAPTGGSREDQSAQTPAAD